ncbi:MAG: long-chain fatty acid--CoA ligase [Candidatus Jordarchaeales archaeon]
MSKITKVSGELPDYIKKRIWLKSYPPELPAEVEIPENETIASIAASAAKKYGDMVSMVFYGREFTYTQMDNLIRRFATALKKLGVEKGETLAIHAPNCPQFAIAYFAAHSIGAVVTALSPLFVAREVGYQLKDSKSKTLVVMDMFYPHFKAVKEETEVERVIAFNILGQKPQIQDGEDVHDMSKLIAETEPKSWEELNPGITQEDLAVLQYTGGTTGLPKAAMLTHRNIVANVYQCQPYNDGVKKKFKIERVIGISILPWYHIYGQTVDLIMGMAFGSMGIVFPRFDPGEILDAIQKYRPNYFFGVTPIFVALLNHPKIKEVDMSCLVYVNNGATSIPVEVVKKWDEVVGVPIVEGYGLSEASPVTHTTSPLLKRKIGSIGTPIPSTLAGIIDPETLEWLPPGKEGELVVSGPQVMKGYWNRPEETEKVFFEAGGYKWLRTGDIAKMDEDGYFWIIDRVKDIIKYKGHSVYPREVEEILYQHPAILEAAVVGVPDPEAGENIKAYVVLKPEYKGKVTEQELINWCKERLAAYKYPRMIEFIDQMPKSAAGKILRRLLREKAKGG